MLQSGGLWALFGSYYISEEMKQFMCIHFQNKDMDCCVSAYSSNTTFEWQLFDSDYSYNGGST